MAAYFTSGYKAEYIALLNEVETKFKKVIVEDITNNVPVNKTSETLDKLIAEFSKNIPDEFQEKKNMVLALKFSKRKLYNEFKLRINPSWDRARKELEAQLGIKIYNQAQLLQTLMSNLRKLDAALVPDVSKETTVIFQKGTPYIANYYQQFQQAIGDLAEQSITEPLPETTEGKVKGAMSLRSLVELNIRQKFHQDQFETFRKNNKKLAWVSTHADCSERCEKFQGKLYSLDGTSGTIDGYKYEPIEKATDIFVRTKNGRVWKNGLFGFNCRHRLIEYEDKTQPPLDYTSDEIAKEREITNKQRYMERLIFKKKLEAKLIVKFNPDRARSLNVSAKDLNQQYQAYSKKNNHAFYPTRVAISKKMLKYYQGD
jgi:hypothetical protein